MTVTAVNSACLSDILVIGRCLSLVCKAFVLLSFTAFENLHRLAEHLVKD